MKQGWLVLRGFLLGIVLIGLAGSTRAAAPETSKLAQPPQPAQPQDTDVADERLGYEFTYQGYLTAQGRPANGEYDFWFYLWDAETEGIVWSDNMLNNVPVNNGLFGVTLDFGTWLYGLRYWLEIFVRPSGGEEFVLLTPRQEITAAPYAQYADRATYLTPSDGEPMLALQVDEAAQIGIGRAPLAKLDVAGSIKSSADTILTLSPYDFVTGDLELLPDDQGYVYLRANSSGTQRAYLAPSLPAIVFGTRQKLKGITVCYQLDDASSYISRIEAFYSSASGEQVTMFADDTDRTNTAYGCYDFIDPTPDTIVGATVIRFWMNYAGTGYLHDIVIGRVNLYLTEE